MRKYVMLTLLAGFVLLGSLVFTVSGQEGLIWRAAIYDNPFLADPPAVNREYTDVDFNWGGNAPVEGVNPDNFSIRFATDVFLDSGTYRFTVRADDSAQLWIDYQKYLDTIGNAQPGEILTVDVPLSAGDHHIQLDYRENTGLAYVSLDWENLDQAPPTAIPTSMPIVDPDPINYGVWNAQYFANPNLNGAPVVTLNERHPSHIWDENAPYPTVPADNFSARWSNTFYLDSGLYQLEVRADDGVRVAIDGVQYIDEWHSASGEIYNRTIYFDAGYHTIVIEYYEGVLDAFLRFDFRRVYETPEVVSTTATAEVLASVLNVRDYPGVSFGDVITKIERGETYRILARTPLAGWWKIAVGGQTGWVSARWVDVNGIAGVPVEDPPVPAAG